MTGSASVAKETAVVVSSPTNQVNRYGNTYAHDKPPINPHNVW